MSTRGSRQGVDHDAGHAQYLGLGDELGGRGLSRGRSVHCDVGVSGQTVLVVDQDDPRPSRQAERERDRDGGGSGVGRQPGDGRNIALHTMHDPRHVHPFSCAKSGLPRPGGPLPIYTRGPRHVHVCTRTQSLSLSLASTFR